MKIISLLNKRNATNAKKAQKKLMNTYQKAQQAYILGQINKTRNPVGDRQSQIAQQTVNEMTSRKSTMRAKLKAVIQEERTFQESAWKLSKVTDKTIRKIINSQTKIKLEQFTVEELNAVLTEIKSKKAASLDELPPKLW